MQKLLVFISHITTEKEIAVSFKGLVEEVFLGMIEVFYPPTRTVSQWGDDGLTTLPTA